MTYIFYGMITIVSVIIIFSALVNLVLGLFSKEKKRSLKVSFIWFLCGIVMLYCLYYAGEYRSLTLDNVTKERLLSLTVINNSEQKFIIDKEDFKYDFDVEIEVIDGHIIASNDLPYFPIYTKIYVKEFHDDNSFVLVLLSESNREFDKFHLYLNILIPLLLAWIILCLKYHFAQKKIHHKFLMKFWIN